MTCIQESISTGKKNLLYVLIKNRFLRELEMTNYIALTLRHSQQASWFVKFNFACLSRTWFQKHSKNAHFTIYNSHVRFTIQALSSVWVSAFPCPGCSYFKDQAIPSTCSIWTAKPSSSLVLSIRNKAGEYDVPSAYKLVCIQLFVA